MAYSSVAYPSNGKLWIKTALHKRLFVFILLLLPVSVFAQVIALDESESLYEKRTGWLPYLFASDALGAAIGVAGFTAGELQPQTSLFGTAFVTSNDSILLSGAFNNYRPGNKGRLLIDTFILADHFTDQRFYAGPTQPGQPPPGSNDSDPENYSTGISNEMTLFVDFKYTLPIGSTKDDPISVYRLKHGLLDSGPSGGATWNPLTHGQTTAGAMFFYTYRDLNDFTLNQPDLSPVNEEIVAKTNGIKLWLEHDNTDFPRNPSRGSRQVFNIYRDFGLLDSSNSWTNLQASFSKYFDLGSSDWFNQKVIALNFWTSDTLDWERNPDSTVNHRPSPNFGSELGGFDHLRAYQSGHFRDKSAVNYTTEMRFIPTLQPLDQVPLLHYFQIDWWQIAPFIEAGRVGPNYNTELYFEDLKWNAGVGIRIMAFAQCYAWTSRLVKKAAPCGAIISQPFSRTGK